MRGKQEGATGCLERASLQSAAAAFSSAIAAAKRRRPIAFDQHSASAQPGQMHANTHTHIHIHTNTHAGVHACVPAQHYRTPTSSCRHRHAHTIAAHRLGE
eukprot:GHVU01098133.1.p3 GENE.GHVU01098133.1~~GHVU01098133.1.p3  ORF type:complete len:101 (-),score=8.44 GHVU01098133.1:306-608(-)